MKRGMNGFQVFAGILFALGILGTIIIISVVENPVFIGVLCFLSTSILFFFMYALGEIIKQLRIANQMFYDNNY